MFALSGESTCVELKLQPAWNFTLIWVNEHGCASNCRSILRAGHAVSHGGWAAEPLWAGLCASTDPRAARNRRATHRGATQPDREIA